jgi:hypothetical protein
MATQHYKLPYDDEHDKDIIDWINSFSRNKKGEMVRHAIRYYMSQLEEGEAIKFPNAPTQTIARPSMQTQVQDNRSQASKNAQERPKVRPSVNIGGLK